MKSNINPLRFRGKKSSHPSQRLIQLGACLAVAALLIFGTFPARAIAPGAPIPGGSFDHASYLGFTGANASVTSLAGNNLNGVRLSPSPTGGYYFYFYLIVSTPVSFSFSTNLPFSSRIAASRSYSILHLYNSQRYQIKMASTPNCKVSPCTATLTTNTDLIPGAYFLWVDFTNPTPNTYTGYLTWTIPKLNGSSPTSSLTWYNQEDLYGQMPSTDANHWYKVNLAAGASYKLKFWATTNNAALNVYVYSDSSTSKPIASAVGSGYPKTLTITVPSRAVFVYVRVENANKGNAEYAMLVTR
jgi:hypothetical protein